MGLFAQQPEQNEEWAGLPSEPLRAETEAERLATTPAASLGYGDLRAGAVESIVIPVAPVIEIVESQASGEGDD